MKKIYVASSWRNIYQQEAVHCLRAEGFKVYDFRNPGPGNHGFHWSEIDPSWQQWTPRQYIAGLEHPIAEKGFGSDMTALRECDICVLVLPCNRSAHLEAGWAAGNSKRLYIYIPEPMEPELMYKMADGVYGDMEDLICAIWGHEEDDSSIEQELTAKCQQCRHAASPPPDCPDPCDSCVKRVNSGTGWALTNFSRMEDADVD